MRGSIPGLQDHDLSRRQSPNQPSHPGTPKHSLLFPTLRITASKAEGLQECPVVGSQAVASCGRHRIHPWRLPRSTNGEQMGPAVWKPPPAFTLQQMPSDYPLAGVTVFRPGTSLCDDDSLAKGGLCNLCPDRANREHILQTGGIPLIINCLSSPNEETVLSAVTTIMYLSSPGSGSHPELTAMPVVQCMLRFSLSANTRLRNLAQIFLEDFCSPSQVAEARTWRAHSALGIPLPRTEAPQQP
ncbi:armadillo repeat-containing protein 7 isoform X1 [Zalophus californianus]|uniref:Armadillo repeat-containing protein 7 isoform X1 n=1 Tax=Zalophus californianus TaxID=9704 RepID=A0A6J2FQ76_ZALCA|nr:armadillo repeat-containing protein 7 isoform X1 [Zalophus californianus]